MDTSYTYKCHNCGGNVKYDESSNKWICDYCNSSYSNLFDVEGEELESAKDDRELYYHYCESCNNSYYSLEEQNTCYKCNNKVIVSKEMISDIISESMSPSDLKQDFVSRLYNYKDKYSLDLNNLEVKDKYVKCDAYNGFIRVSNDKHSIEYVFLNVIRPYIDTDNYKILYDFSNEGFNSFKNVEKIITNKNVPIDKIDKDRVIDNNDIKNKIIDTCIASFKKEYGNDNIKVEESLKINKHMLIKLYYYSFVYNNKEYTSYFVQKDGSKNVSKGTSKGKKDGFISVDIPKDDKITPKDVVSNKNKYRITNGIGAIFSIIGIFCLLGYLLFSDSMVLLIVGIVLLLIGILTTTLIAKTIKSTYGELTDHISISEELYYKNLVNNSKFVKQIRR